MKDYKVTIEEKAYSRPRLSGEFRAETKLAAIAEAKRFYAYELDTTEDQIHVISVEEL